MAVIMTVAIAITSDTGRNCPNGVSDKVAITYSILLITEFIMWYVKNRKSGKINFIYY
jgi:hypothetical protein